MPSSKDHVIFRWRLEEGLTFQLSLGQQEEPGLLHWPGPLSVWRYVRGGRRGSTAEQ